MGRNTILLLPSLQRRLTELGQNIRLARLRRLLSASQIAERTGITRPTLRAVEHGDPNVALGIYANVLLCLGLESDLELVARDDILGRKLQDAQLSVSQRSPRRPRTLTKTASRLEPVPQEDLE